MAKNFVQLGENLTLPVSSDVKSGDLVQVQDIVGIALTDAKTDDGTNYYTTIATKGVWSIPMTAAATAGKVVSVQPKGGSAAVAVGVATESVSYASGTIQVPVLLIPGLSYGAANPPASE